MAKQFSFIFACVFLFFSSGAGAQTRKITPNSDKITEIRVLGSKRFQSSELSSASGLKIGGDGDDAALKQAADRLAESGMFTSVTYSYVSSPQGTQVKFQVEDADKLFPVHADNFVWLSPEELNSELEKREPLFRGEVPGAGEMYTRLADDMTAILANGRMSGQVPDGGAILGFLYTVGGVNLPVRSIEFVGASPEMNGVLQRVAASTVIDTNYSLSKLRTNANLDFLPQYRMRGFLQASFGEPTGKLQDAATGAVRVELPVKEGLQYKLSGVQWSGNMVFSTSDLSKSLRLKIGQPLNQEELEEELNGIAKVYGTRGYLDANLKPSFTFDDAGANAMVHIDAQEGAQYHFGELQFANVSESAAAPLRKFWKLRAGDVYDNTYPGTFISQAGRTFDFSQFRIQVSEQAHHDTKTVDVTFRFTKITP